MKNAWCKAHLSDGKSRLPFSFVYGGQPSAALLAKWPVKAADERLDANRRRTLTWTDLGEGMAVAFRRKESPFVSAALPLRGLEPQALSAVEDLDSGVVTRATGQTLQETGLAIAIHGKPGTRVHVYRKGR